VCWRYAYVAAASLEACWQHRRLSVKLTLGLIRDGVRRPLTHAALKQALKTDARRPKREQRTAKALYAELR